MEKARQESPARLLSLREYARLRGVSLFTVQAAIRDGRITTTLGPDGKPKIDPATADPEFVANTDPSKQGRKAKKTYEEGEPAPNSFLAHRTSKEGYQSKLRRLEYLEKRKKLLPASEVKAEAFRLARTVRDSLLNIPDRLAGILAAETDPHKVHLLLTDELTKALEALALESEDADK